MASPFRRFYYKLRDSFAARVNYRFLYDQRALQLQQSMLTSSVPGVTDQQIADVEIIVSLTTHHRRIFEVYLAIESIMQGSVKPNRIILWLSAELADHPLPVSLQKQCQRGLEIRYTSDIGPYTKLIPALQAFPASTIVTIDDDIIYPFDTLEMLLQMHGNFPMAICGNHLIQAQYSKDGRLASFPTWSEVTLDLPSSNRTYFFEGLGGVLYPAHCFTDEVFDTDTFLSICPKADDIWFNCMALLAHTPVVASNTHYRHLPLLYNESVQDMGLWRINNNPHNCYHDEQLRAVMSRYSLHY